MNVTRVFEQARAPRLVLASAVGQVCVGDRLVAMWTEAPGADSSAEQVAVVAAAHAQVALFARRALVDGGDGRRRLGRRPGQLGPRPVRSLAVGVGAVAAAAVCRERDAAVEATCCHNVIVTHGDSGRGAVGWQRTPADGAPCITSAPNNRNAIATDGVKAVWLAEICRCFGDTCRVDVVGG